jgi:hypothetical protein
MPRRTSDHLNLSSRSRTGLQLEVNTCHCRVHPRSTHLNLSEPPDCVCPCRRRNANSFSSGVRYDAVATLVGRSRYATLAARTVLHL